MHVIETLETGGAENVVANMVNRVSDRFQAVICCLIKSGPVAQKIHADWAVVLELGKKSAGNDFKVPFRLAAALKERRIDVVQSHNWGALCETAAAAWLAKTPVCIHMGHGPTASYSDEDPWRGPKSFVRRKAERVASWRIARFIAVSDHVRREFVEEIGVPARKVELIHNGIEIAPPAAFDQEAKRREAGLTMNHRVLCTVGRLASIKNYRFLLESLPHILTLAGQRVKLIMIGDGPEREVLEETVRSKDLQEHVVMLGERSDVKEWLALSDVFFLTSHYEGISIALLEAMAQGVPAVATRVGGTPEVVVDGENGRLVELNNGPELVHAAVDLLKNEDKRKCLGRRARASVENAFNLERICLRYENIYLEELWKQGVEGH